MCGIFMARLYTPSVCICVAQSWWGCILLVYVYVWLSHGGIVYSQCMYMCGSVMVGLYTPSVCICVAQSWWGCKSTVQLCVWGIDDRFVYSQFVYVCGTFMGDICSKCMYMFGTFIVGFYIDRVCMCMPHLQQGYTFTVYV